MTSLYAATLLGSSVYVLLWSFLAYSFVGVVVEGLFFLACARSLESRSGLLFLPLRPLYGFGGCAFVLLLRPVVAQPVAVFVLGAVVATVVEYLASLLTDRLLGAVSWDYSDKLLNLQGRVCLVYSLAWGGLAVAALYLLDTPLRARLALVPRATGEAVLSVLLVLVAVSAVVTLAALVRTRQRVTVLRARAAGAGDAAAGTGWVRLVDRLVPDRVLINSFPRMTLVDELVRLTGQQRVWIRLPGARGAG
jgi:uncharacterized membrane protein